VRRDDSRTFIMLDLEELLPFALVNAPRYTVGMLRVDLAMPFAWTFFGRQFLVVAEKP